MESVHGLEDNMGKMAKLTSMIYTSNATISIFFLSFFRNRRTDPKSPMERQRTQNSQNNPEKEEIWSIHTS